MVHLKCSKSDPFAVGMMLHLVPQARCCALFHSCWGTWQFALLGGPLPFSVNAPGTVKCRGVMVRGHSFRIGAVTTTAMMVIDVDALHQDPMEAAHTDLV